MSERTPMAADWIQKNLTRRTNCAFAPTASPVGRLSQNVDFQSVSKCSYQRPDAKLKSSFLSDKSFSYSQNAVSLSRVSSTEPVVSSLISEPPITSIAAVLPRDSTGRSTPSPPTKKETSKKNWWQPKPGLAIPQTVEGWTRVISKLCREGKIRGALAAFYKMCDMQIQPDLPIYLVLVRECLNADLQISASDLVKHMYTMGVLPDVRFYNMCMMSYGRKGQYERALEVYHDLERERLKRMEFGLDVKCLESDSRTYIELMRCYTRLGDLNELIEIREEMRKRRMPLTAAHYIFLVLSTATGGKVDVVDELYREIKKQGIEMPHGLYNAFMEAYCRVNCVDRAEELKNTMERLSQSKPELAPDRITYGVLAKAYGDREQFDKVDQMWKEMAERGIAENVVFYNMLIDRYARAGNMAHALKLKDEMESKGVAPDSATYSPLILQYGKLGDLTGVKAMHEEAVAKKITPSKQYFNILINAYFTCKDEGAALAVKESMHLSGLEPDAITFNIMMERYIASRQVDDALQARDEMRNRGIDPTPRTHEALRKLKTLVVNRHVTGNPASQDIGWVYDFPSY